MIKYGIKLWNINYGWFDEAVNLFNSGIIDLVEVYIVPGTVDYKKLEKLKKIKEVSIHNPHFKHGFLISELNDEKVGLVKKEIIKTADFFNSDYIVVHAGIGGDKKIFSENIKKIYDKRIIIENMPKLSLDNRICFGHSSEQLEFIKYQCTLDICFDIGHAIKSAISQEINYKEYLQDLINKLEPSYFHICDGTLKNEKDEHLNLGEGEFDFSWIKKTLLTLSEKKDIKLIFEVPKNKNNLQNDIENIKKFKAIV